MFRHLAIRGGLAVLAIHFAASSCGAGFLYVSRQNNTITKIDTVTGVETVFANTGLNQPRGLAFDSAGNLFVANSQARTILRYTPDGTQSVFASGLTAFGLAIDAADNVYVGGGDIIADGKILRFTPGGVSSVFADTGLAAPYGLAFDESGNLFVASYNLDKIDRFTPAGVRSTFATTMLDFPEGLAFDAAGNLYVANYGNGNIVRFTPGGVGSIFSSTGTGLTGPVGLAFDELGNLYSSDLRTNNITRITPAGDRSVLSSGRAAQFLAYQPSPTAAVPEPSSLVMACGGAIGLAVARWRRKRQAGQPAAG